jgi:hypothetical protein
VSGNFQTSTRWYEYKSAPPFNLFQQALGTFVTDKDEIRPQFSNVSNGGTAVFQSSVVRSAGPSISSTINQLDNYTLTNSASNKQLMTPWYSDQILPFDITLTGANEYGAMCAAKIFGVEILNEGSGVSIDDAVTEMNATFVARVVEPMSAVASPYQTWDFPPLPCFGTIENHYRPYRTNSGISIYMNHLHRISGPPRFSAFQRSAPRPPARLPAIFKTAPVAQSAPKTAPMALEFYLPLFPSTPRRLLTRFQACAYA